MLRNAFLMVVLIMMTISSYASTVELFVAPAGSDANPGTRARPYATLERARDAIRARKAAGALPAGGVTVWLRGGCYLRTGSFTLNEQDSGTAEAPISYRAYHEESVRLLGGKPLTDWTPVTDPAVLGRLPEIARGHVLQTDLHAHGITNVGR